MTDYEKGYKYGQKETFAVYDKEVTDMSNDYSFRLKQLQKENEELKAQIIQERDLHTQASKNYLQTIKELKAQIEK